MYYIFQSRQTRQENMNNASLFFKKVHIMQGLLKFVYKRQN